MQFIITTIRQTPLVFLDAELHVKLKIVCVECYQCCFAAGKMADYSSSLVGTSQVQHSEKVSTKTTKTEKANLSHAICGI